MIEEMEQRRGVSESLYICPEEFQGIFIMITEQDICFMQRAAELAGKGRGWVNPNPLVGAVIVRDGRVIGEGWHERYGGLHAERNAFKNCREDAKGATMYVTFNLVAIMARRLLAQKPLLRTG